MRILATTALALAAVASPAFAQDADFSGPRVDVAAGYDNVGSSLAKVSNAGVAFAGSIGYDAQVGKVVLGVDAEVAVTTVKDEDHFGSDVEYRSGRDLYAGARLGYVLNAKTLVYVKGGYVNGRLTFVDVADDYKAGHNFNGFRVGAGVERKVTGNVYAKAEYRYTDYELYGNRHQALVGFGYRF